MNHRIINCSFSLVLALVLAAPGCSGRSPKQNPTDASAQLNRTTPDQSRAEDNAAIREPDGAMLVDVKVAETSDLVQGAGETVADTPAAVDALVDTAEPTELPDACAPEQCNGVDDDCDGIADEGFPDLDMDGKADCVDTDDDDDGYIDQMDCDPLNPAINPEAPEACNGVDDDCDGLVDETSIDHDADGQADCVDPDDDGDGALDDLDCEPFDPAIHPGAVEICNDIDDNCDLAIDGQDSDGCEPFFFDMDKDGFAAAGAAFLCLCQPEGPYKAAQEGDCDDADPLINPLAVEVCNLVDDNCNDSVDEFVCFLNCDNDLDCLAGWECNPDTGVCFNLSCLSQWDPGDFNPQQEWAWTGSNKSSGHKQVMATPSVADLDMDGVPEVVFNTFAGSSYNTNGVLRAIHGDGSGEYFTVAGPATYPGSTPAIGDFTGDEFPEIASTAAGSGIHAWDHLGNHLWTAGSGKGDAAIADLNGDGNPEVFQQYFVISGTGVVLFSGNAEPSHKRAMVSAADLNGDGFMELTLGGKAISPFAPDCPEVPCGQVLWDSGNAGGFTAIGDVTGNGQPDVVVVGGGKVTVRNGLTGGQEWQVKMPGGGGGAPIVADFDGDGGAEIGVAGLAKYSVFDGVDGAVVWTQTTKDVSSSVTGSSVFDFEDDGINEVVYNDEHTLRIYSGPTGDTLFSTPNPSGTLFEYPLVVDVDADNNAEIVVSANDYAWGGHHGIRVFGDASDHWVSTRRIWNQHAYHITNINQDGSVPDTETDSWTSHNTYRCNLQMEYDPAASPDAVLEAWPMDTLKCPEAVLLTILVRNIGTLPILKGAEVGFFIGPPGDNNLVALAIVDFDLEPGGEETIKFEMDVTELDGFADVYVVLDPNGKLSECDETNNTAIVYGVGCLDL